MQLSVWRMPIACEYLVGPKDQPPLRIFLHRGLTDWVEYKAYSRKDAETLDDGRSDKALARFTARYGERPSGVSLKLMGANALRGTQPEWF
ncbi:MAG: hypothetical protein ACRETG_12630, partial [Steroidobacteraceae bacterium]